MQYTMSYSLLGPLGCAGADRILSAIILNVSYSLFKYSQYSLFVVRRLPNSSRVVISEAGSGYSSEVRNMVILSSNSSMSSRICLVYMWSPIPSIHDMATTHMPSISSFSSKNNGSGTVGRCNGPCD